jgi:acetyltransferase-like isoleucine patch superfamily enzyme
MLPKLIFLLRCLKNKVRIQSTDHEMKYALIQVSLKNIQIINKGIQNCLKIKNTLLRNSNVNIQGNNCLIEIGKDSLLDNCKIFMSGNNQTLKIGEGCRIRNTSFWLEDGNNSVIMGNQVTTEGVHFAATEIGGTIEIGNDCMFSYDIDVRNGDSHVILTQDGLTRINYPENIKIGNHVWIGAHAIILKGSIISDNCVIGTSTLVSGGKIESNSLIAGQPGRVIKTAISWERDRSRWIK